MKKYIAMILVLGLLLSLCGCGMGKIEGKGYKTSEEAALAYAEALKSGDVDKVISTFAVETYVENYDMEEYLDWVRAYSIAQPMTIPPIDSYTTRVDIINRQSVISRNLGYMYLGYALEEEITGATMIFNGDPYDDASDLMRDISEEDWLDTLSKMEIGEVVQLEDIIDDFAPGIDEDKLYDNLDSQCDYLGCDELVSLAVEVELDGDDYLLFMDVVSYEGKWYNCNQMSLGASIAGASAFTGGLLPLED